MDKNPVRIVDHDDENGTMTENVSAHLGSRHSGDNVVVLIHDVDELDPTVTSIVFESGVFSCHVPGAPRFGLSSVTTPSTTVSTMLP
jgi:hypothetical protein